jgi:hypothetical protein
VANRASRRSAFASWLAITYSVLSRPIP